MSAPEPEAMRPGLGEGFNPAEADLGLQGTANSPSSTADAMIAGTGLTVRLRFATAPD